MRLSKRAKLLDNIAGLYQENQAELIALATLEAGKTRLDSILEIREAIDFCRYYAARARNCIIGDTTKSIGPVVCISPWNFPLAIFTGQITAALVCGNPVLAKPAEQTTLIAARAVELMYQAGVPKSVLQFVPGDGAVVGHALTSSDAVKGVCFTGSIDTAEVIDKSLSIKGHQECRLIAETGGLNTMIVDSTALLEQVVRDVIASAFQSAGQRCSALRILCVQRDIEAPCTDEWENGFLNKLKAASAPLLAQSLWDSCDYRYLILNSTIETLPESFAAIANTACKTGKAYLTKPTELPGPTGEKKSFEPAWEGHRTLPWWGR